MIIFVKTSNFGIDYILEQIDEMKKEIHGYNGKSYIA